MKVIFLTILVCLLVNTHAEANSIAGALSSLFTGAPANTQYPNQYPNTPQANSQIGNSIAASLAGNIQTNQYPNTPQANSQIGNALAASLPGSTQSNPTLYNSYPPNQQSSTQSINNALASSLAGNNQPYYNNPTQNINNAIANSLAGNTPTQNINNAIANSLAPVNSLSSPTLTNALMTSFDRTVLAADRDFVSFLYSNNVPNATVIPTYQQCSNYRITANGNLYQSTDINYKVTCTLPNGRSYTEPCYGRDSCDYLTCKFLKCGRLPGGKVTRVRI